MKNSTKGLLHALASLILICLTPYLYWNAWVGFSYLVFVLATLAIILSALVNTQIIKHKNHSKIEIRQAMFSLVLTVITLIIWINLLLSFISFYT